jgi:hypothetical protein
MITIIYLLLCWLSNSISINFGLLFGTIVFDVLMWAILCFFAYKMQILKTNASLIKEGINKGGQ